jgi:hypothetical protein
LLILGYRCQSVVDLGKNLAASKVAAGHLALKIVAHPSHRDFRCLFEAKAILGNHRKGAKQMQTFRLGLHFTKALIV